MRGYNAFEYNEKQYNADGGVLALSESLSSSDLLTFMAATSLIEFLFSSDYEKGDVTNKALAAEIRLNDWLEILKPSTDYWNGL